MARQFVPLPIEVFTEEQRPHIARLNQDLRDLFALEGVLRNPLEKKRSDQSVVRKSQVQVDITRITPSIVEVVNAGGTVVATPSLTFGSSNVRGTTTTVVSIDSQIALFAPASVTVGSSSNAARIDQIQGLSFGGTGQTSSGAAFNTLAPFTSMGQLIGFNGTSAQVTQAAPQSKILVGTSASAVGFTWLYQPLHVTLFTASALNNFTTGPSFAPVFGANSPTRMKIDATGRREARIHVRGSVNIGSVSGVVKLVDSTHSVDATGTVTLNTSTVTTQTSTWMVLGVSTILGDCEFEAQAQEGAGSDVLRFENIQAEFR